MTGAASSKTFNQLAWVSSGRIALVGTWFLATTLMARVLGPTGFGFYFYCQAIIKIITGCVGDPLDMAVMRQGPLLYKDNRSALLQLVRSAFWIRVAIGLLILLAALALPALASRVIFNRPDFQVIAIFTFAGVLGDFLLRAGLGYFQIGEQFGRFMAVDSVWQGGRVVAVLSLVLFHKLTPRSAVVVYVLAPYVAFAFAWLLLPADLQKPVPPNKRNLSEILHYSKWMATGLAMAAAYEQLDKLFLAHFAGDAALGMYAAAFTWAVIPDFINGIIQTVMGPKIAPAHAAGQFNTLQKTYLLYAVPIGIVFATIAMLLVGPLIHLCMSEEFAPAINVFRILLIGTLFNTVFIPLPEALMNFIAPKRVTVYTSLGLIWVVIGGITLIPRYGPLGAAVTIVSARIVVGCMVMVQAHHLARKNPSVTVVGLPSQLPAHFEQQT
jgi:O-antigen/teichoic acid export membrane protein